ncbi:MAG TPA: bifunctional glutamate N-acetyltransferase/amino-acid acetyltransferase ArgJ [Bdellovibrionota bacterium]|jgi:glutamate N-acetyltransferase/amino-acid N-acetyltransferase|nr:bifunctional glutamate N-acetyltransferase/amino-acid acetyltransferase ArgJ [Bdellovibrionota bacterium]
MIPNIALPQDFEASGVNCGVRKYRPDLGILRSLRPAKAVGVFTRNTLKAAPVQYCMSLLPSENIQAIVVNSGQANVATGEAGIRDCREIVDEAAKALGLDSRQVLASSTGVVGDRIPTRTVIQALPFAVRSSSNLINNFALAIMTTDLIPKFYTKEISVGGKTVRITGASKGSGMIHPNMGTMLAFVATDAEIALDEFQNLLRETTDKTFNMISVDGETSTNDMVIALANGASGAKIDTAEARKAFAQAFDEVLRELAIAIAKDGEGASKLITVDVQGAPRTELARDIARAITTSPLIKSAVHGEDPNWGRILVRIGMVGTPAELIQKMTLKMQDVLLFDQGSPVDGARARVAPLLKQESIVITINLGAGEATATAWGCDLSTRYVEINTAYS